MVTDPENSFEKFSGESLQQKLALTEQVLNTLEDIYFVFTEEGRVIQWNQRIREVTGYTNEQIAQMHPTEFVPADEVEHIMHQIQTVLTEGQTRFTGYLKTQDGEVIPYEFSGSLLEHEGQRLICGTGRDISQQLKAQEDLQASEEKFRVLAETATDAIIVVNADGIIKNWSQGAHEIFGYREEEVLGKPIKLLVSKEHQQAYEKERERVKQTGKKRTLGKTVELEGLRKNGERFPTEFSLSSWMVGEQRFFASIVRDITNRRAAEKALRESEIKFRTLTEESLVGIVLKQNGVYSYVNPTFAKFFGYSQNELIGQPPRMVVHPESWPKVKEKIAERLNGSVKNAHFHFKGLTKDGEHRTIEVFGSRISYRGKPAIISTALDVTERRHLEREVLRIQEKEQQRIGQELHDGIVSQLTGIAMMTSRLAEDARENRPVEAAELEELTEMIQESAQQARLLSQGLNPMQVGQEDLLAALQKLAANTGKQAGLKCSFEMKGSLPNLKQEIATHLYRIAQEATNNAVKHAEAHRIYIKVAVHNGYVDLVVEDDGKGMSEEKGEGLGLHTMRYRADLLKGHLTVKKGSQGGTVVRCRIEVE